LLLQTINGLSNTAVGVINVIRLLQAWPVRFLLRQRERLRSIVMSMCVCVSVCVSVCPRGYLWNHTRDLYQIFVNVAYVVAWSSSRMLTIGRIACRREGNDGSAQRNLRLPCSYSCAAVDKISTDYCVARSSCDSCASCLACNLLTGGSVYRIVRVVSSRSDDIFSRNAERLTKHGRVVVWRSTSFVIILHHVLRV